MYKFLYDYDNINSAQSGKNLLFAKLIFSGSAGRNYYNPVKVRFSLDTVYSFVKMENLKNYNNN